MPRISKQVPPHVSLRGVRLALGLTGSRLAEMISDRTGEPVSPKTIYNVENGEQRPGNTLLVAWAETLRLNPRDIVLDAGVRELVAEADREAAA